MIDPILRLTDGCTVIDLLHTKGEAGFFLDEWLPAIPDYKQGGTWRDSVLANSRRLADRKWASVVETLSLKVRDASQNDLIYDMQEIRRLLEKAADYWTTSWQDEPVWLEAKAACEDNMRYALILRGRVSPDDAPYRQPFMGKKRTQSVMDGLTLVLERDHFTSNQPGTGTATEISAVETYSCGPYHLEFDGADSIVNCGNHATLNDIPDGADITVDGWVRCYSDGENDRGVIMQKSDNIGTADGWCFRVMVNGLEGRINSATVARSVSGSDEFDEDEGVWHHVLMTYDETGAATPVARIVYLAIDGIWVTSYFTQGTGAGAYATDAARDLLIGNGPALTRTFDGDIGWIRVSDNVRYTVGTDFTPPPRCDLPVIDANTVAQWIGAERAGATIDNQEGNANNDGTQADCAFDCDCYRNFGNVDEEGVREPTTADEVYVANKRNVANITHIRYWDVVPGQWNVNGNLMDAPLPYAFLPNPVAVGDEVYFGIDTSLADSGPFCSLVFDVGTIIQDVTTIAWEYWNGGAWTSLVPLGIQDNTDDGGAMTGVAFNTAGVGSVHWVQELDWAATDPNPGIALGLTGYWVRARVVAIGATPTPPQQQNRDIYSITWPYLEVQGDEVGGDVTALAEYLIHTRSGDYGGAPYLFTEKIVAGLRSYNRGASFTAYLNLADEQNPTGLTVSLPWIYAAFADDVTTPTGRRVTYNPVAALPLTTEIRLRFDSTLGPQFQGHYHAYLRYEQVGGSAGDISVRLALRDGVGSIRYTTQLQPTVDADSDWKVFDFGRVTLPPTLDLLGGFTLNQFDIDIQIETNAAGAAPDLNLYDLILIPVDEYAVEATTFPIESVITQGDTGMGYTRRLRIDGITHPKITVRAAVEEITSDNVLLFWNSIAVDSPLWQARERQRLWLFATQNISPSDFIETALPYVTHSTQALRQQRYLSMRGDR